MTKAQYGRRGLLYILPWLIGFLVFNLYPISQSLWYSLTDMHIGTKGHFVGLKNFEYMFTKDDLFWQSLRVTLVFTFVSVPAKIVFALFVAMLLNMKTKGANLFRLLYYMPSILGGSVVLSILWRFLFMREGFVNLLLQKWFGVGPVDWFGPKLALGTLSLIEVWQFGSSMVLFLAALKSVPLELYEAAMIDGSKRTRMFFSITIPMITPILFFNIIMQLINAFQHFTSFFIITGGGPMHKTYVLGMKIWEEAFSYSKLGYAAALSWVLVLLILVVTFVIFATSRFWVYNEDSKII
ncbi:MAG: sugar ABC transporter permease [Spirochaetes bacterium]|nr:sugar ABC transporter permease [Spirochaetota bacterium]